MNSKARQNPETALHIAILHHLLAVLAREAAATLTHVPMGGKRSKTTGALMKRLGARPGVGDLVWIWDGRHHEFEVKRRGESQSSEQRDRERAVLAAGGRYAVCRSTDHASQILASWGHPSRESARTDFRTTESMT